MTFGNNGKELRKGEKLVVTIGDVLHNTLLVFLDYRKTKFCGVLLNTSNRRGPYGIEEQPTDAYYRSYGIDESRLNAGDIVEVAKAKYISSPTFPQTINTRTTYGQEIDHPPPRQIYQRRRRSKRKVRMDMMDTDLALKLMTTSSGRKLLSHPSSCCCDGCASNGLQNIATDTSFKGKRKLIPDAQQEHQKGGWLAEVKGLSKKSKQIKLDKEPVDKPLHEAVKNTSNQIVKCSPVIKISYKSPGGKGRVLKIPPRLHSPPHATKHEDLGQSAMHERARKFVIRAKTERFKYLKKHNSDSEKSKAKSTNDPNAVKTSQEKSTDATKGAGSTEVISLERKPMSTTKLCTVPHALMPSFLKSSFTVSKKVVQKSIATVESSSPKKTQEVESKKVIPIKEEPDSDKESPNTQRKRQLRNLTVQVLLQPLGAESSEDIPIPTGYHRPTDTSSPDKLAKAIIPSQQNTDSPPTGPGGSHKGKDYPGIAHSISVTRCTTKEGVQWCQGDVVWGKIMGFPWWPGVVRKIVVKKAEDNMEQIAIVDWFQSKTVSHIPCNALESFSGNFNKRYRKKTKGNYRKAILEAREAEKNMSPEVRKLIVQFET